MDSSNQAMLIVTLFLLLLLLFVYCKKKGRRNPICHHHHRTRVESWSGRMLLLVSLVRSSIVVSEPEGGVCPSSPFFPSLIFSHLRNNAKPPTVKRRKKSGRMDGRTGGRTTLTRTFPLKQPQGQGSASIHRAERASQIGQYLFFFADGILLVTVEAWKG